MKNKFNTYAAVGSVVAGAALLAGTALPAFALGVGAGLGAQLGAGASASTSVGGSHVGAGLGAQIDAGLSVRAKAAVNHADMEITRRLDALNALAARVDAMVNLSGTDKSNISAAVQSQISALQSLQSQIGTDAQQNNTSSLKADIQSIIKGYRIFALILPQGAIEAAAGRVLTITNIMADLGAKFSARIAEAQSAGNNTTAAATALADFNAKISDAGTQANAAVSAVAGLAPDNGNQTIMASNTAALKDARAKIVAAQHDLIAARADAMTIIRALAGFKVPVAASTTVSSTASTSAQ